jgi:hypothetical protein
MNHTTLLLFRCKADSVPATHISDHTVEGGALEVQRLAGPASALLACTTAERQRGRGSKAEARQEHDITTPAALLLLRADTCKTNVQMHRIQQCTGVSLQIPASNRLATLDLCMSISHARGARPEQLPITCVTCAQATEVLSGLGHHVCAQLHDNPAQSGAISGHVEEHLHKSAKLLRTASILLPNN